MHFLANGIEGCLFEFRLLARFLGLFCVVCKLLRFRMLFENSLAERGLELLEVLSRNIVLNDPNWALDARAVSKFIPGVVLVEDFENPLSFDCLRVVGRTRHL